MRHRSTTVK